MSDPALLLDASSEEEASWMAVHEAELEAGIAFVARARALARAAMLARQAGRTEFVADELMACLRIDRTTASRTLHEALMLTTLPRVCEAIEQGRLGVPHAKVLVDELAILTPAQAAAVEAMVLPSLEDRSPSRVRDLARRAVLAEDPDASERRRVAARAQRRLTVQPDAEGMAWIRLLVPAERALAVLAAADEQTRGPDATGRSADERRADWALRQLLREPAAAQSTNETGATNETDPSNETGDIDETGATKETTQADDDGPAKPEPPLDRRRRRRFQAVITVPVAVALGLSDEPCDLAGYGPITAAHARELIAEAELRRVCVDSLTGQVVASDRTVHRPVPDDDPGPATPASDDLGAPPPGAGRRKQRRKRRGRHPDTGRAAPRGSTGDQVLDDALKQARAVRACLVDMVLGPASETVEPEPQYQPSAELSRTVQLRDVRCTFPCCSTTICDDDHLVPWPRGATHAQNLHRLSRHHHRAKQIGWTPSPMQDGGTLWQAPSGRTYRRPPSRPAPPTLRPGARLTEPMPPAPQTRPHSSPVELDVPLEPPTPASPVILVEVYPAPPAPRPVDRTSVQRFMGSGSLVEALLGQELDPAPF